MDEIENVSLSVHVILQVAVYITWPLPPRFAVEYNPGMVSVIRSPWAKIFIIIDYRFIVPQCNKYRFVLLCNEMCIL